MWEMQVLLLSSIQQALVTDRFVACVHLLTLLVRDFLMVVCAVLYLTFVYFLYLFMLSVCLTGGWL